MIIIDNMESNYKLQPDNGFNIKNFEGEEEDNELLYLQRELIDLALLKLDDVTQYIPTIRYNMKLKDEYEEM